MASIIEQLAEIYTYKANTLYGLTTVLQQQHALQTAMLAEMSHEPASLITAALLHDVGHMIHDLGDDPARQGIDDDHEQLAAVWLSKHFGPEVTEPIRLHVAAKRYLCAIEPDYLGTLASDSVRSLHLQGGVMSAQEVAEFASQPYAQASVRLRRYDDLAKEPGVITPSVDHFLTYVRTQLAHSSIR